jgi:hypothetical protein
MLEDCQPHIGVLLVSFHIPAAQSLKDKRMVIRSLRDRVKNKFNVSVSEIDGQDKWQVATFGFVMINSDHGYVEGCLQSLLSFVGTFPQMEICEHRIEMFY